MSAWESKVQTKTQAGETFKLNLITCWKRRAQINFDKSPAAKMTFFLNPVIWGSKAGPNGLVFAAQTFYEKNGMDSVDMGRGQFHRMRFDVFKSQLQGLVKQEKSLYVPQQAAAPEHMAAATAPAVVMESPLWSNLDEFQSQASAGFKKGDFDAELNQFVKERSYHNTDLNVLEYYAGIEAKYPTIARLARRYLCIPSSNVASESLWSLAGFISEDERSRISADMLETQLMIRRNHQECKNVKEAMKIE